MNGRYRPAPGRRRPLPGYHCRRARARLDGRGRGDPAMTKENGLPAARSGAPATRTARRGKKDIVLEGYRLGRRRVHALARDAGGRIYQCASPPRDGTVPAAKTVGGAGHGAAGAAAGLRTSAERPENGLKPRKNGGCHVFVRKSEKLRKWPLTVRRTRGYKHPTFGAADAAPQTSSLQDGLCIPTRPRSGQKMSLFVRFEKRKRNVDGGVLADRLLRKRSK